MLLFVMPADQAMAGRDQLERLLAGVAAGRQDAAAALYEETKTAVYGFSLSILKNAHDAEDVLQETYLRIWTAAGGYRPRGKPMAWVLTIARNLSMTRLRERSRTAAMPEEDILLPESPALTHEDRLVLRAALEALGEEERRIVMLHAVSGLRHREIADLLELPLATVLSKYHRAKKRLQSRMQEGNA